MDNINIHSTSFNMHVAPDPPEDSVSDSAQLLNFSDRWHCESVGMSHLGENLLKQR